VQPNTVNATTAAFRDIGTMDMRAEGDVVRLVGRGFGHGVGMCQWGAHGMAEAGHTYVEILEHCYRGSKIHKAYE
jgi:stage II sporulation protein D